MHPQAKTDLITLVLSLAAAGAVTLAASAAGARLGVALSLGVIAFTITLVSRLAFERLHDAEKRPESGV